MHQTTAVTFALALSLMVSTKPLDATTVIHAAGMVDVRTGRIVEDVAIVVEDDRIVAVGAAATILSPPAARTLDLGSLIVVPGLMDLHTHLTIGGTGPRRRFQMLTMGPVDFALQAAHNARATLAAGFTTVREAGANDFIDAALARAIERGTAMGPRIVPSGYQISMTGGHGDEVGWPPGTFELGPEHGVGDGVPNVLRAVRYQVKHGARVIKMTATAGVSGLEATADARQFSDEEMTAIVDEARRHRLKVAAHAHGREGILAAVRAGVASIEHGSQIDREVAAEMIERGVYLVPTAWINTTGAFDTHDLPPLVARKAQQITAQARESLRLAIREGVPIAYGTDAGVFAHGTNAVDFAVLVEAGMTPIDAIRSATLHAADLLGVDDRGALEPGLLADIVAVPGNPLDEIGQLSDVRFVMKGGVVFRWGTLIGPPEGLDAAQLTSATLEAANPDRPTVLHANP